MTFLGWTIEKNELNRSTASALRTACKNVLSIEDDWEDLDLRSADKGDLFRRFTNRDRTKYNENSLNVYRQRFNQAVNMYLTYLDDGDWRPRKGRATPAVRNGTSKLGPQSERTSNGDTNADQAPAASVTSQPVDSGLIEYPFPIRPGVRAQLALPEDLTPAEADRLAAHIKTLAFDTPAD